MIRILMTRDAFLRSILPQVKAKDPAVARRTASVLSRFDEEPARIGLLHLLHHSDRSVVLAAIEGLRAIGTVHEVEHLLAIGAGWFGDRSLRRSAREAIDAIQARTAGTPGSLSLVSLGEAGALSAAA